ncbi:TRAP transporter small permease [Sneathiella glossodoripedis]|uniref:TRAP transporter small permease n=1 Tax=Sneathiella glossodoripedis TaxID=418853 RepID=UPI00047074B7|nr:TRAP transporter small permease subunit [Sneathiella glossodoripedis]
MISRISARWANIELTIAGFLAATITGLILLNVVTRSLGTALFWVDELAIYAMAWMTFLGASAALHYGQAVAVTIFTDVLKDRLRLITIKLVDLIIFIFALLMLWFCWIWYSPVELAQAGFDTTVFQEFTFNFIYAEPTTTLGIKKFWIWLAMWVFALGATLHSTANLLKPAKTSLEAAL